MTAWSHGPTGDLQSTGCHNVSSAWMPAPLPHGSLAWAHHSPRPPLCCSQASGRTWALRGARRGWRRRRWACTSRSPAPAWRPPRTCVGWASRRPVARARSGRGGGARAGRRRRGRTELSASIASQQRRPRRRGAAVTAPCGPGRCGGCGLCWSAALGRCCKRATVGCEEGRLRRCRRSWRGCRR